MIISSKIEVYQYIEKYCIKVLSYSGDKLWVRGWC